MLQQKRQAVLEEQIGRYKPTSPSIKGPYDQEVRNKKLTYVNFGQVQL